MKPKHPHDTIAIVAALVCVSYVLSAGPAAWLCQHGFISGRLVEKIYTPLGYIGGSGKESWLMQYLDFWKS